MKKIKLAVIFGGMSTENEVSIISGTSVIKNINKEKYEIFPIYIDKKGTWHKYPENQNLMNIKENISKFIKIENVTEYIKKFDVVFPVLHGLYGEDGTIQGMLELLKIPYVGCNVLASSVGMDKAYTKVIFEKANLKQADYIYIRKNDDKYIFVEKDFSEEILNIEDIVEKIVKNITFPMFVKPSNSGSSVGVRKVVSEEELKNAIEYASSFDKKIIIEQGIKGKEVECAVLGNEIVKSSCVGEIIPAEEFYSYDAKYNNSDSKTLIPANISEEISEKIQYLAIKAFKAINGAGLARVDFFVEDATQEVYINEINTMPGFTSISMYPKLWEKSGIQYEDLLDRLIQLDFER